MADIVYLVRHAAPPADLRGRYWGTGDPGLDRDGLDGVGDLAELAWVAPQCLLSSPLRRALLTAEKLGERFGLRAETIPGLAEVDFGRFDGLSWAEVEERFPLDAAKWAEAGDAFVFPGGEPIAGFLARATEAFETCISYPRNAVLCVTHGGVIAAWCCLFLRMSLDHRFAFRPDYAALTAFLRKKDGSGWEMVFFNNRK